MQATPTKPRDPRALNSMTHGLTGRIYHLTPEDAAAYEVHVRGYHESLAPSGPIEADLVQAIADDRWRLKRAATLESAMFLLESDGAGNVVTLAEAWMKKGRDIALISLYESRIQRRAERNLQQLREIQTQRKAAERQFLEEAASLAELAESKGETFDPAGDFAARDCPPYFAFSTRELSRHRRLTEARKRLAAPQKPLKMAA